MWFGVAGEGWRRDDGGDEVAGTAAPAGGGGGGSGGGAVWWCGWWDGDEWCRWEAWCWEPGDGWVMGAPREGGAGGGGGGGGAGEVAGNELLVDDEQAEFTAMVSCSFSLEMISSLII